MTSILIMINNCKNCHYWKALKAVDLLTFDRGYCYCLDIATKENYFCQNYRSKYWL